jgi:hypothetical protein
MALALASLAAFSGCTSCSGCEKKKSAANGGESPVAAADAGASPPSTRRHSLAPPSTEAGPGFEKVSIPEIEALVPTVPHAQQIAPPMLTSVGRRVNVVQCYDGNQPEKIKADLVKTLEHAGWQSIATRDNPPPQRPFKQLFKVTAEKDQYRLTIMVKSAPFHDCREDQKKVRLVMSFFKRTDGVSEGPPPAPLR